MVYLRAMSNIEALSIDPFNHYNTEFVKLDANNWQEDVPPELQLLTSESFNMRASPSDTDSEPADYLVPIDSVNVCILFVLTSITLRYGLKLIIRQPLTIQTEQVLHRCHLYRWTPTAFKKICRSSGATGNDIAG